MLQANHLSVTANQNLPEDMLVFVIGRNIGILFRFLTGRRGVSTLGKDSELAYVLLWKKSIEMLQKQSVEALFTSSQFTKCPALTY